MKFNKLLFTAALLTILTLAACSKGDADDAEYTLNLPHIVQTDNPAHKAAEYFQERLEEESEGKIEVKIYPNGELYDSDRELIEGLQSGDVDVSMVGTPSLGNFEESLYVLDLPFIFPDKEAPREALDGELGDELEENLEEINLKTLVWGYDGFRQLINNKHPIEDLEDVKDLKIRVQESQLQQDMFNSMGANASPLAFGELYAALQQKTYDGMEAPIMTIDSDKFYEVQDYMTVTEHQYSGLAFLMSDKIFEDLPEDLQEVVESVSDDTEEEYYKLVDEAEESLMEEYKEDNTMEVTELSEKQKQEFIDSTDSVYEKYAEVIGQDIIDLAESYSE